MKGILGIIVLTSALSAGAMAIAGDSQSKAVDCPPGCCDACPAPCETECSLTR